VVLLVACVSLALVAAAGCTGQPAPSATGPVLSAARVGPQSAGLDADVDALLSRRESAVREGDAAAWEATVDAGAPEVLARERQAFAGLLALPLEDWSQKVVEVRPATGGGARATVEVSCRLTGDDPPARVHMVLDLVRDGEELAVAGSTATPRPLWDVPDVASAVSDHAVVVGDVGEEDLASYAAQADRAAVAVADLASDRRPPHLSLVVVRDWDTSRLLIGTGAPTDGLAALATRLESPGVEPGPVRIVVDPAVLARLEPAARGAVLAHEAFHVATQDLGPVPLWLSEGLADHAGYRSSGVPLDRSIAGFLAVVRADGPPDSLPADADFAPGPAATVAYEGAHLAVRMLVDEHGEPAVLRLHERVAEQGPDSLEPLLEEELGTDLGQLTRKWQAEAERRAAG
jgi:hypothetical protein